MYVPIIVTIILISLDAVFIGMSLKLQRSFNIRVISIISATIFSICVSAYFVAGLLAEYIGFNASWFVGIAFLLLAIRHLFAKSEENKLYTVKVIIFLGIIMSIDAVVATTVLTLEHDKTFLIPILAFVGHLIFLLIGGLIARFINPPSTIHKIISASCLFLIAILNFVGIL